ncbi:MAG: pantetheine-phosphate adenylyltransferase [Bacillota bacterium]|nr:pantetheine-phosphate adenylyltransferase [Bacillota bacterium]REJ37830.1 MAG: pantetheine-phosphate adenylyltransferase [Bacillota bacterium]
MTVAAYPGSFDPVTNGHLDIIHRASRIFDQVIVALFVNLEKSPMFTAEERLEMVREVTAGLPNVTVESSTGLLVDFCRRRGVDVVVRGLRAISDFDYEFQMAQMNKELYERVETVFMMTRKEHLFLSSSIVKEIARLGGDVSRFVPEGVHRRLMEKIGETGGGGLR